MRSLLPALLLYGSVVSAATVTLQRGQTGTIGFRQLTVISVQDNRCPINADCPRVGEPIAKVLIKQNDKRRLLTLQYPEAPKTGWAGLRIKSAPGQGTNDRTPVQMTFTDETLGSK